MNSPTQTFVQEAVDGLEEIEALLLALEDAPDKDSVDALFRALHTIKGSGAMFGFDALAAFTHSFETAFDLVRSGKLALDRDLINLALDARDHMSKLLHANDDPAQIATLQADPTAQAMTARIDALVGAPSTAPIEADAENSAFVEQDTRTFTIEYRPAPDSLRHGARPDLLIAELAELGALSATLNAETVPDLASIDPTACYLGWNLTLETDHPEQAISDVFVFVDEAEFTIKEAPTPAGSDHAPPDATPQSAPTAKAKASVPTRSDTVKVPAARLDDLMDQLGELVIAQTRLLQLAQESDDSRLGAVAEEVDRLVTGLRDSTLAMRMLPIEVVFGKFRRVVRSLADELGKEVTLVTAGGDTELDKNVIDSLTEPLVHMIRNSMDHGIETTAERSATGKPPQATIGLVARQSGGEVLISVTDDGRGLNDDKIIAKARDRGLIGRRAEDVPPPDVLHQLIFEPAFSTADALSNVSGRGVGMDAVKRVVTDLRGSIDVTTQAGVGTAMTLRLPVTLAIIDGLLVRVGQGVFVLPLSAVHECVELNKTEYTRKSGRTLLKIRDEMVPFIKLDELLAIDTDAPEDRRVIIVSNEGRRIGLVVDDVLGQHQTVIKTFSQYHRDVEGFAGSTILGDGRVALIIDIATLIKTAQDGRRTEGLSAA